MPADHIYYRCKPPCLFASKLTDRAKRHQKATGHTVQVLHSGSDDGLLTTAAFLKLLEEQLPKAENGKRTAFAVRLGISPQFLSKVMAGRAYPGPKIAKALGFEQVIAFRRVPPFTISDVRKAVDALANANVRPHGAKK